MVSSAYVPTFINLGLKQYCLKELFIFTDCPGTQSESAGKVSACQGCPNQSICASGAARGPDPGWYTVS